MSGHLWSTTDTFLHTLCAHITVDNNLPASAQTACVETVTCVVTVTLITLMLSMLAALKFLQDLRRDEIR